MKGEQIIYNCNGEQNEIIQSSDKAFNNTFNYVAQEREKSLLGEVTKSLLWGSRI